MRLDLWSFDGAVSLILEEFAIGELDGLGDIICH